MKILLVHSFLYFDHGGDSVYTLNLGNLLTLKGHEVAYFGMENEKNISHKYSKYEMGFIDYEQLNINKNINNQIKVFKQSIYSAETRKKMGLLLDDFKPDIVHLQSIHHHLTTSIIHEINSRDIPIIWSQHNLNTICISSMINGDKICEKCKPNKYYSPLLTRCKKGSFLGSLVGSVQLYFDHFSNVYDKIDKFVMSSYFHYNKLLEFNFPADKLIVFPTFTKIHEENVNIETGKHILYFGNIETKKGVETLIDSMALIKSKVPLLLTGEGHRKEDLEKKVVKMNLKNVKFLGYVELDKLKKLILTSYFTIIPSICYDNYPNSIIESFSLRRPVIGSLIGGIPELIENNRTGLLVEPGNADDLAEKIDFLLANRKLREEMGRNGRDFIEKNLNPEIHYKRLFDLYRNFI